MGERKVRLDVVTSTDIEVIRKRAETERDALTPARNIGNLADILALRLETGGTQGIGLIGGTQGTGTIGEIRGIGIIGGPRGIGLIGGGTRGIDLPGEILDLTLVTDTGYLVDAPTLTQVTDRQGGTQAIGLLGNTLETNLPGGTQGLILVIDTGNIVAIPALTLVTGIVLRNIAPAGDTPERGRLCLRREAEITLTRMKRRRMNFLNQTNL